MALAGAAGTLCRFFLAQAVNARFPMGSPMGTFAVNVLGCLAFGAVWAFADSRVPVSTTIKQVALVGFMGAFTTFSSLVFETASLARAVGPALAFLNYAGQTVLGFAAFFLGAFLGKFL